MKKFIALAFSLIVFVSSSAFAELHLVLNKGVRSAIPIVIVPFGSNQKFKTNIAHIIGNDLQISGHFQIMPTAQLANKPSKIDKIKFTNWQESKYNYMLIGSIKEQSANLVRVNYSLVNLVVGASNPKSAAIITQKYTVPRDQLRKVAHEISDSIFHELTGYQGVFNSKIAYVYIQRQPDRLPRYFLKVADMDGYNPQNLVESTAPLMSPAWSPNGADIAYVSLANHKASIYIVNVATGQQRLVSDFEGINGAPAWSPDGKQLAIVLSKTGEPKLYLYTLSTGSLKQLTHGFSIDTEPSFSHDGKSLIFTSNRGGEPQIYQLNLASGSVNRVTFNGNYNARSSFTKNGNNIVVLHRDSLGYNIAIQNLLKGDVKVLTSDNYDSSPSVAPNGQMVIYANDATVNGALKIVSANGQSDWTVPTPKSTDSTVLEPAWDTK